MRPLVRPALAVGAAMCTLWGGLPAETELLESASPASGHLNSSIPSLLGVMIGFGVMTMGSDHMHGW